MATRDPLHISNAIENKTGGCLWLFMILFYVGFMILIWVMAIDTNEKVLIPIGIGLTILMLVFNTLMIYYPVKQKKRIAAQLFNQLVKGRDEKLTFPSLFKFTVAPRYNFLIDNKPAQIKLTQTRRGLVNQLIAMQLETPDARLKTELNRQYLLPGWKGNIFRMYLAWDYRTINEYVIFQKSRYSSTLSNAIIRSSGSKLVECKIDVPGFDSLFSCYTDSPQKLKQLLSKQANLLLLTSTLKFNEPFTTKLEIGKKGVFITTILTNNMDREKLEMLFDHLSKIIKLINE